MNPQLVQWLADLRPLMGVVVIDLELASARDHWVRSEAGPWGGSLDESELDDRATQYARAWRSLATSATTVVTTETEMAKVMLRAVDAQRVVAFLFDPKTPLGLARLHVSRAMPKLRAEWPSEEAPAAADLPRPTGAPITASYESSSPVGADEDQVVEPLSEAEERPGLPPPTHPPGAPDARPPTPAPPGPFPFHPSVTPAPPGPVPRSAGPIDTTPGVGMPTAPETGEQTSRPRKQQPAPTLTSAGDFTSGRSIEDDETEPGNLEGELSPETHQRRAPADEQSARYAGPMAGATRPTTTLNEASTETAARGVRILAYLDAHAEDAHIALLRVSLQTGLSVETLRGPENLTDDEVDFVAASVRRILGRPLEM